MHIVCSIAWNRKSHHQKDFRTFIPMLFFSFGFLIFGMHLLAKSEGNPWYHSQVSSKTHNKESRKSKGLGPVNRFVIHTYQISVSLASIIDSMWTMRERKRSQESGCHRDHCPAAVFCYFIWILFTAGRVSLEEFSFIDSPSSQIQVISGTLHGICWCMTVIWQLEKNSCRAAVCVTSQICFGPAATHKRNRKWKRMQDQRTDL